MIKRTSLLIEPNLLLRIKEIAVKERRSVSKQINKIIEEWFTWKK